MSNGPLDSSTVPSGVRTIFRTGVKWPCRGKQDLLHHVQPQDRSVAVRSRTLGPAAAQVMTLAAVADGRGGLLSSGTNIPLRIAHFFDQGTLSAAAT